MPMENAAVGTMMRKEVKRRYCEDRYRSGEGFRICR
jgi:hypothetical protein